MLTEIWGRAGRNEMPTVTGWLSGKTKSSLTSSIQVFQVRKRKQLFLQKTKYSELKIGCFTGIDQAWYKSVHCLGDWTELLLQLSLSLLFFYCWKAQERVESWSFGLICMPNCCNNSYPITTCFMHVSDLLLRLLFPPRIGQWVSSRAKATGLSTCSVKRQSWKTTAHVTNSRGKTGKHITKMAEFLKTWEAPKEFTSDKT